MSRNTNLFIVQPDERTKVKREVERLHVVEAQEGIPPSAHASSHITGGSDEVDGDQLDIDWNPSGYTPATTPSQVTNVDHLTAHLYGISEELLDKLDEDGSVPLTADWDIGNGRAILADKIRARGGDGLALYEDGDSGVFIEDGGQVGIGTTSPERSLHIGGGGQSPSNAVDGLYVNPNGATVGISVKTNAGVEGGILPHTSGNVYMGAWSNHSLLLTTNNTLRATLSSAGLTMENSLYVASDEVRARDSGGLSLSDDSGTVGVFVEDGGQVGIGTTSPTQTLEVNGLAQVDELLVGEWPAAAGYSFIGTDTLTQTAFGNYALLQQDTTGTTFINSPDEIFVRINNTDALHVDTNRDVGIGTTSVSGQLHIDQDSASGAQPVLYLDQADVSEEFIRFQATAGDSNAVSTKIVGSHYGRVRVNVNGTDMWMPVFNDDSTSDWTGVTFATGWGNLSGAQAVEYRKIGDIVYLRGTAERTSGSGTTIFTLPSGYRPPAQLRFANRSRWSNSLGEISSRMTISAAGVVSMTGAIVNGENWLSHDGYNFSVTA